MATKTTTFGTGKRESHDSSLFYDRGLTQPTWSTDTSVRDVPTRALNRVFESTAENMEDLPNNSVALMITSPPYHVGKDYDSDGSFDDFLKMLRTVLQETYRVLEPGGRMVVNVANLGRKPYVPLASIVTMMSVELG